MQRYKSNSTKSVQFKCNTEKKVDTPLMTLLDCECDDWVAAIV